MDLTQENIYYQRINAVIDHVRANLEEELSLQALAQVAGFSPFHFHRIFKSLTNETLNDLVVRLRLERAAALLRANPQLSITDAAFAVGFKSISVFSRAFKKQYGLAASQWNRQTSLQNSKIRQPSEQFPRYTVEALGGFAAQLPHPVQLRSLPAQRLAYIRVYNPFTSPNKILDVYQQLLDWYCGKGGKLAKTTLYGMSQDDPEITPRHLYRFDWCLTVPNHWQGEGDVNMVDFPACEIATIHFTGDLRQEFKAWQYLYRYWLPNSRYQPANLPAMEIYRQQPVELGWETFDMECALPIVTL